MPSSPSTKALAASFVCDCNKRARSACEGLPFYKKLEDKRYCVLHYPGKEKGAAFSEALRGKFAAEDFDFGGVWFPDDISFFNHPFDKPVNFSSATFSAQADFTHTVFGAEADFAAVTFCAQASFYSTTFHSKADFSPARFNAEVSFNYAIFNGETKFDRATFGAKADFFSVTFNALTSFRSATFMAHAMFAGTTEHQVFGPQSSFILQSAVVERPEHFSFHTLTLRPHWFASVDARRFEFINVSWDWHNISTAREIKSLGPTLFLSSPYPMLAIACRNLAVNAEENHRYEDASRLRYMAMDAPRLERWHGFAFWTLGWWYWLASGYGERVWRAFVVLLGVWLLAAALYTQVGFVRWEPKVSSEQEAWEVKRDEVGQPLRGWRALTYSLGVMTLQKPEPRPATDAAQAVVMLETILGPVQAALLALAIRRKFMR